MKITAEDFTNNVIHFCPFKLMKEYFRIRGDIKDKNEQFFIFRDGTPVGANIVRSTLSRAIRAINLNEKVFQSHSFRIGRCCDLLQAGYTIEEIKRLGRWKSNAVFHYLK